MISLTLIRLVVFLGQSWTGGEAFEELVLTMTIDGNPETTTKTPKT